MRYSVVIPSFNEEENIERCIKEVKKQAPYAEIVLADADSTDNTQKIARSLGARIVIEKKRTIAAGRQKGLEEATGDIVCFVDSDTIPDNLWFEKIIKPFSNEKVVAVGGITLPFDGKKIDYLIMYLGFAVVSPVFFKFNIPIVTGQNMAVRRKQALEVGGFKQVIDETSGEDMYIFMMLRSKGKIVHSKSVVKGSARRMRNWGLKKFVTFNIRNFFSLIDYQKPLDHSYEPIRKK